MPKKWHVLIDDPKVQQMGQKKCFSIDHPQEFNSIWRVSIEIKETPDNIVKTILKAWNDIYFFGEKIAFSHTWLSLIQHQRLLLKQQQKQQQQQQ